MSAQVSCRDQLGRAPLRSGIVSVTTMPDSGQSWRVSKALPGEEPVGGDGVDLFGPLVEHGLGRRGERAAGGDDVVDDHRRLALDVTDHGSRSRPRCWAGRSFSISA